MCKTVKTELKSVVEISNDKGLPAVHHDDTTSRSRRYAIYRPDRQGVEYQISQLTGLLQTLPMSPADQVRIGSAVAFLREVQRILPLTQEGSV